MGSERAFTAGLAQFFRAPPGKAAIGIGDDAAVVRNRASHTVVACDPVVEGVHFEAAAPLRLVGRKAVNRNLSDLAAMGATFDYAVVSVLWPRRRPTRGLMALMRGVRDAVEGVGGYVVGGDTASTDGPLTVTVTALGHLAHRVLRRDGARTGHVLFVSAPLGGSTLGHHLRFVPPLTLGRRLARRADVTAAIDISDGLALDLATLLASSSRACGRDLCAHLVADRIPVSAAARRLAKRSGRDALEHALGDGEDHALLYAVRVGAERVRAKRRAPNRGEVPPGLSGLPRGAVGMVSACDRGQPAGAVFLHAAGANVRAVSAGYEHALGSTQGGRQR